MAKVPETTIPELAVLSSYAQGSPRGELIALDALVIRALNDTSLKRRLEKGLVALLEQGGVSIPARQYICAQLARFGGKDSAGILGGQLADPILTTDARIALEAMPDKAAEEALRSAVPQLSGALRAGVLTSLGTRRDAGSVRLLARELRSADPQVQSAALGALGDVGTTKAAAVLRAFAVSVNPENATALKDALLVCAEHLAEQNLLAEAAKLRRLSPVASPAVVRR